jgi:hypothetical protein
LTTPQFDTLSKCAAAIAENARLATKVYGDMNKLGVRKWPAQDSVSGNIRRHILSELPEIADMISKQCHEACFNNYAIASA